MGVQNQRPPVDAFDPRFRISPEVQERIRRIERMDNDLSHIQADLADRRLMLRDALSYNAFGTASIEGNPLTLQEVQSLLVHGPTPANMRMPIEREILNWAQFMEGLDDRAMPTSVEQVAALHAALFEGVMDEAASLGRIKDRHNYIGRSDGTVIFIPTPPERAAHELQNALDWYHTASEPPLVKAWLFHHEFEAIHPFLDGNGRLGRALMTLALHQAGYSGVRFALVDYAFNADRQSYYGALAAAHDGDHSDWLRYLSYIFEESYTDAVRRLALRTQVALNPRQAQVAAWFLRVCSDNKGRRVKFGDVHAAFPHLNRRTLQEDIKHLVKAAFLIKEGERKATTYRLA